jgi:excisionase family DNA binding protein
LLSGGDVSERCQQRLSTGLLPASPVRKGGVKGSYTKMAIFLTGKPRPGGRGGFTNRSAIMANIVTAKEIAQYLKLTESTIYKLASTGELPGFRIGKSWRFDMDEILKRIKDEKKSRAGQWMDHMGQGRGCPKNKDESNEG